MKLDTAWYFSRSFRHAQRLKNGADARCTRAPRAGAAEGSFNGPTDHTSEFSSSLLHGRGVGASGRVSVLRRRRDVDGGGGARWWRRRRRRRRLGRVAATATPAAPGQVNYVTHCSACHGVSGEGQPNWLIPGPDGTLLAPPHDNTGHTWHHGDGYLFAVTKRGGSPVHDAGAA